MSYLCRICVCNYYGFLYSVEYLKFHLFQHFVICITQLKSFFLPLNIFTNEIHKWLFVVLFMLWYSCCFLILSYPAPIFAPLHATVFWYPFRTSAFLFVFLLHRVSVNAITSGFLSISERKTSKLLKFLFSDLKFCRSTSCDRNFFNTQSVLFLLLFLLLYYYSRFLFSFLSLFSFIFCSCMFRIEFETKLLLDHENRSIHTI